MNNPINNQVFDTRDLIEYREYLESEMVELFNNYLEDHNRDVDEEDEMPDIDSIDEVDFNLEGFAERNEDEITEFQNICRFCDELEESAPDFKYGSTVIHENYFTDYTEQLCEECGYISKDFPSWIEIDWAATSENVLADYSEATYDGDTYYIR